MNIKDLFGTFAPKTDMNAEPDPLWNRKEAAWSAVGGALQGLGTGLMTRDWSKALEVNNSALDEYRKGKRQKWTAQQLMEEAAAKKAEREQAAAEQAQREEFLKSLPPDVQMKARSVPGFLEDYIKATDPTFQQAQEPKRYNVGGALVDADGNVIYKDEGASETPKWKQTVLDDGVYWVDETNPENRVKVGERPKGDTRSSATELKELWKSQDEIPVLDNTIDSLQTALALNDKTFTGYTAGLRGDVGTKAPGVAGFLGIDPSAAKATSEFNKIMTLEAVKSMAETLKGATTDQELARFVEILADPGADPGIRKRTIERMISLAEKVRQLKTRRVLELNGSGGGAGGGIPDGITPQEWNAMTPEEQAEWQ